MQMINSFPIWGEPDPGAVEQMNALSAYGVLHRALMADHHLGYSVPVGGVVAWKDKISPNAVGFDIACGNKAVRLDADADKVRADIVRIMDEIEQTISFGMGRSNHASTTSFAIEQPAFEHNVLTEGLRDKAWEQFGTVGGGNHYIDVFVDESERIWVGVHFGSRGLGHTICSRAVKLGGGKDGINVTPVLFDDTSDLGEQYIDAMKLAGRYAYAARDWVCSTVANIIGAGIVEEVHNHHNFAWRERHFGEEMWVIRKGATPAWPGQKGFVGGSMGDISVILEGVEHADSKPALYSTVHGAGRFMSRNEARGKICRKTGRLRSKGRILRENHDKYMAAAGVEVRGGDLDESPFAYKRIEQVLDAHSNTIRILHTLKPIGVAMAPPTEYDPYKD